MFLAARVFSYKVRRETESFSETPVVASNDPTTPPSNARSDAQEAEETSAAAEKVLPEIDTLCHLAHKLRRRTSTAANSNTVAADGGLDRNLLIDLQARLERPRRDLSSLLENRPLYARQQS